MSTTNQLIEKIRQLESGYASATGEGSFYGIHFEVAAALEVAQPRQVETVRVEGADAIAEAYDKMQIGQQFMETDGLGRKHRVMKVYGGFALFDNGSNRTCIYGEVDEEAVIEFTPTEKGSTDE